MSQKPLRNARIEPEDILSDYREDLMLAVQEYGTPVYKENGTQPTDVVPTEVTEVEGGSFLLTLSNGQQFRVMAVEVVESSLPEQVCIMPKWQDHEPHKHTWRPDQTKPAQLLQCPGKLMGKPNVDWSWDALEQAEQSARASKKYAENERSMCEHGVPIFYQRGKLFHLQDARECLEPGK